MVLHLLNLDVLDELDEIKMCVEYDLDGKKMIIFQLQLKIN